MTKLFMRLLLALLALGGPFLAQASVTGMQVEKTASGGERVTFKGTEALTVHKVFTLANPDRVVVDLARTHAPNLALPKSYQGTLIRSVRFGQFDAATSRIVLDMSSPARLVVVNDRSDAVTLDLTPQATGEVAPPPVQKPLVMIDAGHGGQDPGAIGLHGTREKDVTLNFARALRDALLKTGRYRVALTRDGDVFVKLQDRVAMARKQKADIFISFHADSNPKPEARGLSIYTLSETASDDEAAALAERENKADIIEGIDLNTADADVASILIDLTQRETMNKSAQMADAVVKALDGGVTRLEKTHRFAGFRVLKAPDIPSALVELGFLSNATDERLLLSPKYRDLVIASVVKGIDRFRAVQ